MSCLAYARWKFYLSNFYLRFSSSYYYFRAVTFRENINLWIKIIGLLSFYRLYHRRGLLYKRILPFFSIERVNNPSLKTIFNQDGGTSRHR